MSKDRSQKYPPLALPAKSGKAKEVIFLPVECVGAYCIRFLALPAKDGKAKEVIFLPVECVGVYCIRPPALPAKDKKAQGSLFPIPVG